MIDKHYGEWSELTVTESKSSLYSMIGKGQVLMKKELYSYHFNFGFVEIMVLLYH